MKQKFCSYYIAQIERSLCWYLTAVIRGTEYICFDRALDKHESIFEFFVPESTEDVFCETMEYLKKQKVVLSYEKKENRLLDGQSF